MKKLITILGLTLGLGLSGFSQNNYIRDRIFQRIENERKFEKCFFSEYLRFSEESKNNGEYIMASYDFNFDGKIDLMAFFKQDSLCDSGKDCIPRNTKRGASIVMINYDGDGDFDYFYADSKNNSFLDISGKIEKMPKLLIWT